MNALAFVHANTQTDRPAETTTRRMLAKAQVAGVIVGLAGGVAAGISGALLTAAGWLSVNEGARHWLSTAGSALLLLTIPLIILGALCLDQMEKNQSHCQLEIAPEDNDQGENNA